MTMTATQLAYPLSLPRLSSNSFIKHWEKSLKPPPYVKTRGRGDLTHHLHSEAPAGNRRMAMKFAKF